MAESGEQVEQQVQEIEDDDEEVNPNYKIPEQKSLKEIYEKDKDDESLANYKKQLLGEHKEVIIIDPKNENCAIIEKLQLHIEGEEGCQSMDLTGDLDKLKKTVFTVPEESKYRISILFHVQREIVTGLKYIHTVKRAGLKMDKTSLMMGSYSPNIKQQEFRTPLEEAPAGIFTRGSYSVHSSFSDDDKNKYIAFEWKLEIVKNKSAKK